MDIQKIKFFLTLADHLNYTKAANELFISQSMLSRHIKSLEEEFNVTLFHRSTREVTLTPAGKILANGLRNLNFEYDALIEYAQSAQTGSSGKIRLGVLIASMLGQLAEFIIRYKTTHPDVQIILSTVETPNKLCNELMHNRIDFGIGMPMNTSYFPNLASMSLFKKRLCIVMSKYHRLAAAGENELSINDFRDETFITPADEVSTAYRELLARCSAAGFTPKVITASDIMTVALWTEVNYGVTFLSEYSVFRGNPNLVFNYLNDIDAERRITLYWNLDNHEPSVRVFLDEMRDYFGKR